jgi:hypothetical protein
VINALKDDVLGRPIIGIDGCLCEMDSARTGSS